MTESQSDLVDFIEEMAVHTGYIYGIEYTHATHDIEIHAYTDICLIHAYTHRCDSK